MTRTDAGTPDTPALPDMHGLLKIIRQLVGEVHPRWKHIRFSPDTLLERELGLDSLARMELCSRLRDETGIELDEQAALAFLEENDLVARVLMHPGEFVLEGTNVLEVAMETSKDDFEEKVVERTAAMIEVLRKNDITAWRTRFVDALMRKRLGARLQP